jgi:hypothetical protein
MKKGIQLFALILLGVFLLLGCSANEGFQSDSGVPDNGTNSNLTTNDVPERKIIYTVDLTLYTKDLEAGIETLRSNINSDEWFDYERIGSTNASFTIRVKSDRLDDFIQSMDDGYDVSHYSKTGTDISLDYLDTTNRIAALEAQYDRLVDLYEDASLSDMITINERLGEIEAELLSLEGSLNTFDSLVDYSQVQVDMYQSSASSNSPFFNRLWTAFGNGINGLLTFFDFILIALATVLPFALIIVPTGLGIYYFQRKRNKKKKDKEE